MQTQTQTQPRPDSPADNNFNFHPTLKSSAHNPDLFNHHPQQNTNQSMYNTIHIPPDYSSDNDGHKPQTVKMNGFGTVGPYRTSASFTAFPNSNRPRHHATPLGSTYRDASSNFSHPYSSATEVFPSGPIPHMTSSTPQAQPNSSQTFEPIHQGRGFDFSGNSQQNDRKQSYGIVDFGGGPSPALLQAHQVGGGKSVGGPLQLHSTHQQQHTGYAHPSVAQPPFSNSIHIQSQTPYGPHVSTNGPTSGNSAGCGNASNMNHVNGVASANPSQEEISTIFVVGFPEDMQEREFQNMFTFCAGFEAATLKIPNKEYTAYGNASGPVPGSMRTNGLGPNYSQTYTGSNDPYNLVTVNQGGVVVDGGRDGPLTSWPATVPGMSQDDGSHFVSGGGPMQTMPPRKQIIGFAKFRSRSEALEARDVLQGRRVDIEKGAVLKAEMAKKNLHTKRGVGPLPLQLPSIINSGGGAMVPSEAIALASGLSVNMNGMAGVGINSAVGMEVLSSRERELGALGAMGLGTMGQWRVSESEEERERKRDREAGVINAMGLGAGARGPRERAEEDERERERRRKEKEGRLRSTNLTAFDAFHSVPPQTISRHPSNSLLSRTTSIDNGTVANSLLANGFGVHTSTQPSVAAQDDRFLGNVMGPWDSATPNGPRKTVTSNPPIRPPSSSRQSPPSNRDASFPSPFNSVPDLPTHQPSFPPRTHQYSPSSELRDNQQYPPHNSQVNSSQPCSSASSVVDGSQSSDAEVETEAPRTALAVSTSHGDTSPQLPSPVSGASSTSTRNVVDQNPPINTLYVGNLPTSPVPAGYPPNYLEESLRELFQRRPGFRKLCFRQKSNGPMCFVEFEDVNFATKTLNDLYGNTLGGLIKGGGIRLSYSKNPLGVRTPTSAGSNGPSLQQQQMQNSNQQSGGAPFSIDAFSPRSSIDVGASILRRESSVTSPPPPTYTFMCSPPPRFFSPAISSSAFGSASSAPLSNNASFPRTHNTLHGFAAHNNNAAMSFSPFGNPPHSTIPDQTNSDVHEHHFSHSALSPSPNNIEAARAG